MYLPDTRPHSDVLSAAFWVNHPKLVMHTSASLVLLFSLSMRKVAVTLVTSSTETAATLVVCDAFVIRVFCKLHAVRKLCSKRLNNVRDCNFSTSCAYVLRFLFATESLRCRDGFALD